MDRTGKRLLATATIAAIALLGACAPNAAPVDTTADVAAIKAANDREFTNIGGSIDTIMSLYTADVKMMAPGEPAVNGAEALRKWLEAFIKEFAVSGKYTTADVEVSGDLALVHYAGDMTLTPKKGGAPTTEKIKGIHVFKRQPGGAWKISQDVWNSDAPPPAASAAAASKK